MLRETQTVLVTGANGFTGSHLCRELVHRGHRVRAMVRPSSNVATLEGLNVEMVYADLGEDEIPVEMLKGVDTVYHIAALFRQENVPRQKFYDVNVRGTQRLLEAARQAEVQRFVHCSTVGVLGDIENPPANEETPYNPHDDYQESKTQGEKLALEYFRTHGLPGTVVRPGSIYGPGDLRFLKLFRTINKGIFAMVGKGEHYYHMVHVKDLVDGIILASEKPEALGEVFILTGPEVIKVKDLVQLIARILNRPLKVRHIPVAPVMLAARATQAVSLKIGVEPPLYPRRLDFFLKSRSFDISKAQQVLGYEPNCYLETGLSETAEWYRQNNYL